MTTLTGLFRARSGEISWSTNVHAYAAALSAGRGFTGWTNDTH